MASDDWTDQLTSGPPRNSLSDLSHDVHSLSPVGLGIDLCCERCRVPQNDSSHFDAVPLTNPSRGGVSELERREYRHFCLGTSVLYCLKVSVHRVVIVDLAFPKVPSFLGRK